MANMKKISKIITAGLSSAALGFVFVQNAFATGIQNINDGVAKTANEAGGLTMTSVINTVLNTMLFIVGLLAVIMLIYGGIRYITSHGDKAQVTAAKDTIMYAVIGLVIAIIAYAVVNWIAATFNTGKASTSTDTTTTSTSKDGGKSGSGDSKTGGDPDSSSSSGSK